MILEDAFVVSAPLWPLALCCFCSHRSLNLLFSNFQSIFLKEQCFEASFSGLSVSSLAFEL